MLNIFHADIEGKITAHSQSDRSVSPWICSYLNPLCQYENSYHSADLRVLVKQSQFELPYL